MVKIACCGYLFVVVGVHGLGLLQYNCKHWDICLWQWQMNPTKTNIILTGLGAMQSHVRWHLLACSLQLFMILCVFAVKEDCCSEKEEGSGKEHCQKKGPQQVLSAAWLASTQVFLVYHSLSTQIESARRIWTIMGRKITCMCFWSLAKQ